MIEEMIVLAGSLNTGWMHGAGKERGLNGFFGVSLVTRMDGSNQSGGSTQKDCRLLLCGGKKKTLLHFCIYFKRVK